MNEQSGGSRWTIIVLLIGGLLLKIRQLERGT